MGRELRRVPADWEHPKNMYGHHIPLHDGSYGGGYVKMAAEWDKNLQEWKPREDCLHFDQWDGKRPFSGDYMPNWPEEERTHYQMYEDTTEGTPESPVMANVESLCHWLEDNEASAFGYDPADYDWWMNICRGDPGFMMFTLPRE